MVSEHYNVGRQRKLEALIRQHSGRVEMPKRESRGVRSDRDEYWPSATLAANAVGKAPSTIRLAIDRGTLCAGRHWHYSAMPPFKQTEIYRQLCSAFASAMDEFASAYSAATTKGTTPAQPEKRG